MSSLAVRPRGVRVELASLYNPSQEFSCFDGSNTIPFMQVNDDYFEDLDGESIVKILDALKRGEKPPCGPQIDRKNSAPIGGPQTLGDMKFGGK